MLKVFDYCCWLLFFFLFFGEGKKGGFFTRSTLSLSFGLIKYFLVYLFDLHAKIQFFGGFNLQFVLLNLHFNYRNRIIFSKYEL